MSVNFLLNPCSEKARNDKEFGICDDQDGGKAYTTDTNSDDWVANVSNENQADLTFTPIDNCIIVFKEGTRLKESTCDGMITFKDSLYLVELKDQGTSGWIPKAKDQLENTIRLLGQSHDLDEFRFKKAYACNKRHPRFQIIEASERKSFFERTNGFRLDIQTGITIK